MNTYEFWNDIDKIYDAIMAYQEKTIEFNKQFINPWVNLSNIFDKKESNEAIVAHKNSIEIDPENAKNWYELANTYTRFGDFDKSIYAFKKAIELGYETGEVYKNLALAYAMTARPQEAIHLFQKALTLLVNDNDKAVVWNQLGNIYRKLNNYEMALQAFQQADQLEGTLPSPLKKQALVEGDEEGTEVFNVHEGKNNVSQIADKHASVLESSSPLEKPNKEDEASNVDSDLEVVRVTELEEEKPIEALGTSTNKKSEVFATKSIGELEEDDNDNFDDDMPVVLEIDFSEISSDSYLDESILKDAPETTVEKEPKADSLSRLEIAQPEVAEIEDTTPDVNSVAEFLAFLEEDKTPAPFETAQVETVETVSTDEELIAEILTKVEDNEEPAFVETAQEKLNSNKALYDKDEKSAKKVITALDSDSSSSLSAYEEYLNDTSEPINNDLLGSQIEENQTSELATAEVNLTNSELSMDDANSDLTVDMDTKNAHVWNELGNVYLNAGALDDAIVAYSRAIELDKQFAWPYSNLATTYGQKDRLDEAILLYQRSIELFSNEKDKAIAWNRLGNVYRRLDDYENAIAAYQRADDLDPGNVVVKHQTKSSPLGNQKVDHEVGYSL